MQYYSGENICGNNRIRYAQRGDYACLVQRAGNTGRQGIVEKPRLLDLSMHKNTEKNTIKYHSSKPNAMHIHMMT